LITGGIHENNRFGHIDGVWGEYPYSLKSLVLTRSSAQSDVNLEGIPFIFEIHKTIQLDDPKILAYNQHQAIFRPVAAMIVTGSHFLRLF
jgi:hypothetical protein